MSQDSRVALFVDAENLTQWVKQGGLETLLEELSAIGAVVVRKAYARWTNAAMAVHQATLNRHGFELIHTFHPVSGKNSADIQITVDVMEYARRGDLGCIGLATGDSDFSPLFRRLRELGKQVVGIGPRSALSESVKSSCSRFFYTQTETSSLAPDEASRASAFDDAADLLETVLKTFDGRANCSALKSRMLNIDSAFDEKNLGFKSFTAFVKAVEGIDLVQENNSWSAFFVETDEVPAAPPKETHAAEPTSPPIDTTEGYCRILRKMQWRPVPGPVLVRCYTQMQGVGALAKSELLEDVVARCDGAVTTADVRKAAALLRKAGIASKTGVNDEGEALWQVGTAPSAKMLQAVDRAMVVRLIAGLDQVHARLERNHLRPLLLGCSADSEIDALLGEAARLCRNSSGED